MADAAVDEDDIGVEFLACAGVAVAAGEDFSHGLVVVVGAAAWEVGEGVDFEAAVFLFEWAAVDEADFAADGFAALEMGDVEALDTADWGGEIESAGQGLAALEGVDVADLGFGLPLVAG